MEKKIKIIIHVGTSVMGSILIGFLGLAIGATIWGNYPFPDMLGQVGYEAGGTLGGLLGISLGAFLVTLILWKMWKKEGDLMVSSGLLFVATILNFFIKTYSTFPYTLWVLLFIPTAAAVLGFWWRK